MPIFKRKDSPYWWYSISIPGGGRIQKSTGSVNKKKAQELHDRVKADVWDQVRLGAKPERTWAEAAMRWLQETEHKATRKSDIAKLKWLDKYVGKLKISEIDQGVIDQIKSAKRSEASSSTVNRYLALVRAILHKARDEWEWLEKAPKVRLYKEPQGRERSLTPEEAARLIQVLPEHQKGVVKFALATGLRQMNVLKLKWQNVDIARAHAWVLPQYSKNRRAIAVPLNQMALEVLFEQRGRHHEYVFTKNGKPLNNANTKAWRAALIRAGIENFRWHDLRHTWATWQRKAGTPTHELQRLGGWKSSQMVERYAHLGADDLKDAANRLDSLVGNVFATKIQPASREGT